jgi:hypothetical protein
MFPYLGSKWRLTRDGKFPPPQYPLIIEPFAGGAGYSLNYFWKQVILCELNPTIAGVWQLLQTLDESFEDLPDSFTHVPDYLEPGMRDLLGMRCGRGITMPRRKMSQWAARDPDLFWSAKVKRLLAAQSPYIRHWQILSGSYENLPIQEATWFLDPPYQHLPGAYKFCGRLLDYRGALRDFAMSLPGQVIVCEGGPADWLPFEPLAPGRTKTGRGKGVIGLPEVWWYRDAQHRMFKLT